MPDASKCQQSHAAARKRYDKANTRQIRFKVNLRTESDILCQLQVQENMQGYIKRLIREDIARTNDEH